MTSGRLLSCSNTAAISGDLNVGGVAGSMAVEYELDPEDDLISNSAPIYRRAYELKAILQWCTNTGARSWPAGPCRQCLRPDGFGAYPGV